MKKTYRSATKNTSSDMMKVKEEHKEIRVPLMLTIEETAEKSGLSVYTIRTWIKRGKLKHIKAGRKYLISWDNFCDFLNSDMSIA